MPLRLLVIDDSLTIRKSVELAMKGEGHQLEFASAGQEGISKARAQPPDVILLDFVLPDMKGTDVCRGLSQDARARFSPVVLMSAKHENVRELFREYGQVVDFIAKPFSKQDILARIVQAAEKRAQLEAAAPPGPPVPAPASGSAVSPPSVPVTGAHAVPHPPAPADQPVFSYADKEEAARAIFNQLKGPLAQIPQWLSGLGTTAPGLYFAKKILTPTVLGQLLGALTPAYQRLLAPKPPTDCLFHGATAGLPILEVLKTLASTGRTGELTLVQGASKVLVYLRRGEVVHVSGFDPVAYAAESAFDLSKVPADAREKAEADQRGTGKSLYLTLAEAGHMPAAELPSVLARQGRHLLRAMLVAHSVRFEWRESQLPAAAEAHGRAIPMSQLLLDRMRQVSSSKDLEAAVPSLQTVFARAERFSQKVRPLSLTDAERKVLALIDGRNTVQALVERTGLPAAEVVHVVHRLGEVALISKTVSAGARSVMILDGDVEGIRRPFAKWLSGRPKPFELVSLEGEKDLAGAVLRERPSMVVIDASVAGHAAESLAQQIGGGHEAASLTLVAFLDAPMPARTGELLSAGYDAVLAKPVQFKDIEALLGS